MSFHIFSMLTPQELEEVKKYFFPRTFSEKQIIFNEASESDGVYLVESGYVKIYKHCANGREKTLAILGPGEMFGEMTMVGNSQRSATAYALQPVKTIFLSNKCVEELMKVMPKFSIIVITLLSERLRETNMQMEKLLFFNAKQRILHCLRQLSDKFGIQKGDNFIIPIKLTHAEIASISGVSRETVTKVFAELQSKKIVDFKSKQMVIKRMDELVKSIS